MPTIEARGRTYEVDDQGFLVDFGEWDREFAEATARALGLEAGLDEERWDVVRFVQDAFRKTGRCPLVYEVCRARRLRLADLRRLFPTGYLRGVCRVAGLSYRDSWIPHAVSSRTSEPGGQGGASFRDGWVSGAQAEVPPPDVADRAAHGTYRVDAAGFLVDPEDWDEVFAVNKAAEIQPHVELNERHWRLIGYLRGAYGRSKLVPTVFETCEANGIDLDELERLFPRGYHRGAVKIAGLRAH